MAEKYMVEHFCFEDKETYERALKEHQVISAMKKKYQLSNGKVALNVYQKTVEEKVFSTIVGYSFLRELRHGILAAGLAKEKELEKIPIKNSGTESDSNVTSENRHIGPDKTEKYRRLYEGQCLLNRRMKIIVVALVVLVLAFVIIDLKSEYSVFTYFTDYEAKMEQELIDKYRGWENDLKAREEALNQNQD